MKYLIPLLLLTASALAQPTRTGPPSSRLLGPEYTVPIPSSLSQAVATVKQLRDELGVAKNENHALTIFLGNAVLEKNEAISETNTLKKNIDTLSEWGKGEQTAHWHEYDRAEKEHAERLKSDAKYHSLKWPLVGAGGFVILLLGFYFLGPISAIMGPAAIYAPAVPIVGGLLTSGILTFLI